VDPSFRALLHSLLTNDLIIRQYTVWVTENATK